jgi:putative chitinase
MLISKELLVESKTCTPEMADKWVDSLNKVCEKYEINTPERIAGFLSQVGHESGGFKFIVENLNYSAGALMSVFGKYFPTLELAQKYERQPEKIANRVYANRMGNGNEESGDGWFRRGRGLIQLTGTDNQIAFGMACDIDTINHPELLETPDVAAESAGWFWSTHKLNTLADVKDVVGMTRRINGGTNGLDDRQTRYSRLIDCLTN